MTYTTYLPLVMNNVTFITTPPVISENKGIALVENNLNDLDSVGASWYYTWTPYPTIKEDTRYIPMSYYGEFNDDLPVDYDGFVLFLNEPNNPSPYGANIAPDLAAVRYREFCLKRPLCKLVVGNTSMWATGWFYDFINYLKRFGDIPMPKYVGIHGYIEGDFDYLTVEFWWNQLRKCWETEAGYRPIFWITEFAETTGNVEQLKNLLSVIKRNDWITRYAYFTNRYDKDAAYIPTNWYDFGLFEDNILSPVGETYKLFY